MSRALRILAVGYYGYANAGDEIVLAGIAEGLSQTAAGRSWELRALSGFPDNTRRVHGIAAYPRFSPRGILAGLMWADCLVLGGGSLIQDATSRRSALYYLWIVRLALVLRRRVFLWAQGFGPLEDPGLRRMAGRLLPGACGITVRDPLSLMDLQGLGVPEDALYLSADPAFLVSPASSLRAEDSFQRPDWVGPVLGVALRPWGSLASCEADLSAAIGSFSRKSGLKCFHIPFQQPHDVELANRVADRSGVPSAVLSARPGPAEMVRLFQELSVVLGMRLHSLILAAKAGAPFVGLSYDPKVERFCRAADMPSVTLSDVASAGLESVLMEVYENRDPLSDGLAEFTRRQTQLALESATLFWKCAGAK